MKPSVRTLLAASALILVTALYLVVLTAENSRRRDLSCQGVRVHITDSARLSFVSEKDIVSYMEEYGPYVGKRVEEVDLQAVENILSLKSAILSGEAYMDRDGYINIDIVQREPAIRFQKGDYGFYADEKGFIFPLQESYTSRVPIIDGAIPLDAAGGYKGKPATEEQKLWLLRINALIAYMKETEWLERISQITVLRSGDLEMIPAQGREKFIFGAPTDIEAKFQRIRTYYEAIAPAKEEGYYGRVDVRFDKQIICKK